MSARASERARTRSYEVAELLEQTTSGQAHNALGSPSNAVCPAANRSRHLHEAIMGLLDKLTSSHTGTSAQTEDVSSPEFMSSELDRAYMTEIVETRLTR